MELEEAAARLIVLKNFFNALGALEEIIATARSVDNIKQLAEERKELAEKARLDLLTARSNLESFTAAAKNQMDGLNSNIAAAQEKFKRDIADLDFQYAAKGEALQKSFEAAKSEQLRARDALDSEIRELDTRRGDLQFQISKLESNLEALKKKVANL